MVEKSSETYVPAAVSVDSGSVIYGQGMQASSNSGLAVSVSDNSSAHLAGAKLRGAVHARNGSMVDLENAVVALRVPTAILQQAAARHDAGDSVGGRGVLARWIKENLKPSEMSAALQLVGQLFR